MAFIEHASSSPAAVPRRAALALGLTAAVGLAGVDARAESSAGGVKLTVIYAPKDTAEFGKYYFEKHVPFG